MNAPAEHPNIPADTPPDDPQSRLRWCVYLVLIFVAVGLMLGRIMAVDSVDRFAMQEYRLKKLPDRLERKKVELQRKGLTGRWLEDELDYYKGELLRQAHIRRPFLSANDRSRWCTIRALVEPQLRVEGAPYAIDKVVNEPNWDTIDMVKHDRRYVRPAAASEKDDGPIDPKQWDGTQPGGHLYSSKPPLLPTLLAGEYWLIYNLTGLSLGSDPYLVGRLMLITFNVIPMIIYFLLLGRLAERFGTTDWGRIFVIAAAAFGTFLTTFAVVINNHLPAAVCAAVAGYAVVRISFDEEKRWWYFVIAGLFAALAAGCELPALALLAALGAALLWEFPKRTLLAFVPAVLAVAAAYFATSWIAHRDLKPAYMHRSGDDNWYDYTFIRDGKQYQSYWNNPQQIDRGEESSVIYAIHVLVGHHGIFSLTPVWLMSLAGGLIWLGKAGARRRREVALLVGGVTFVCLVFYLSRGPVYRNYGGMTSGLRWMFWLAPLWLVTMLPAADRMAAGRWRRLAALLLLALSVLSAAYPTWNPWTHPWLMNYMSYLGWL